MCSLRSIHVKPICSIWTRQIWCNIYGLMALWSVWHYIHYTINIYIYIIQWRRILRYLSVNSYDLVYCLAVSLSNWTIQIAINHQWMKLPFQLVHGIEFTIHCCSNLWNLIAILVWLVSLVELSKLIFCIWPILENYNDPPSNIAMIAIMEWHIQIHTHINSDDANMHFLHWFYGALGKLIPTIWLYSGPPTKLVPMMMLMVSSISHHPTTSIGSNWQI